ncbi:MAG: ABC transporter ATP-binding protein [Gemmatimonadetes bacterium]|nr:ABC transporter ATP-binding protein [Gemmatimonadota bacterium]
MALELRGLAKRFGDVAAVRDLTLELEPGEFVTLLGPSGCGKTTVLRLIAGFETPDAGRLIFDGREVTSLSPQRRRFGMVFQNYALFPHLNVYENVAFGLRARRMRGPEIRSRVERALERVDLPGFGPRAVQELSGGQQQRVALARALAIEPPLLLLDEPLSNLDAALRQRTRAELRALVKALGITALFVTHDQEEAFDLSDRIAVMRAGELRQVGTPEALYHQPVDQFVAGFVGRANTLPGVLERVVNGRGGGWIACFASGAWWRVPEVEAGGPRRLEPGRRVAVLVRPEALAFVSAETDGALPAVVADRRFHGAVTTYQVEADGGATLVVTGEARSVEVGERVGVAPRPGARLHLYPAEE